MEEIWKPVEGFEGLYEVNASAQVRKIKTGQIVKNFLLNTGYLVVHLTKDGKQYTKTIHRIVAKAFIPNPNNFSVINHINEDRSDNRLQNLEWCTQSHNIKSHYTLKWQNDPHFMDENVVPVKTKKPYRLKSTRFVKH